MGITLENNGFQEVSVDEMYFVDGGIDWNAVGENLAGASGATLGGLAGAKIGAKVGWLGGPAGAGIGIIVGGAVGVILYTLWD